MSAQNRLNKTFPFYIRLYSCLSTHLVVQWICKASHFRISIKQALNIAVNSVLHYVIDSGTISIFPNQDKWVVEYVNKIQKKKNVNTQSFTVLTRLCSLHNNVQSKLFAQFEIINFIYLDYYYALRRCVCNVYCIYFLVRRRAESLESTTENCNKYQWFISRESTCLLLINPTKLWWKQCWKRI